MSATTIAAISTPAGAGGIGIVRLSGERSLGIAQGIFRSREGKSLNQLSGYTGVLGRIFDAAGDLDDAIAFVYRTPKSYTGEDVVELSCHGGIWVLQRVLRLCLEAGAVPASPGEFTKRAFLNGKLDLAEAEAVMGLISAQGDAALRAALSARDGALSTGIAAIVEKLVAQSAHLAAWADYPEEEIEAVEGSVLAAALQLARGDISLLLGTWDRGKILREGIHTAIVGRPNVGKSTLMNLLAGEQRSIVTDIPGTTRDVVEDSVRLGDCILRLADTAGIRKTQDPVERIGVERAKEQIAAAGLVLAVFDSSDKLGEQDLELLELLRDRPCIAIINKIDLPQQLDTEIIADHVGKVVTLSARSGEGREALEEAIVGVLGLDTLDTTAAIVANERQRSCLTAAREALDDAIAVVESGMTLDAVNVAIDFALDHLLSLTGQKAADTVVDEVFAHFCVGK